VGDLTQPTYLENPKNTLASTQNTLATTYCISTY